GIVGPAQVLFDHRAQLDRVRLGELFEADHAHVAALGKAAVFVQHVCHAAAHAGGEVAAGPAEHDHAPARHVLAAMVAHALHHGPRAGVAHREALAGEAPEEGPAGGRTVEDGVADDYVLLGLEVLAHAVARTDREDAPREALARVVLRVAAQREGDAGSEPAGE